MTRSETGLASILAVAMTGLLLCLTVAVMCGVAVVGAHRQAESAADLAALAGAGGVQRGADPCGRAAAVALRNHARLQRCEVQGWDVSVVVVADARLPIGRVQLPARARAGPVQASLRSFSSSSRSSRL
jgi:secretion/DNA translocation related TadE-like protein